MSNPPIVKLSYELDTHNKLLLFDMGVDNNEKKLLTTFLYI